MSRSAEQHPATRAGLAVLAATVAVGVVAIFPAEPAAADPPTAPVVSIVAPVIDISFNEEDLNHEARVETQPTRTTITLDSTVLFGKDSAKINSKASGRLSAVGGELKARGPGSVQITGYTDDLGSAAHGKTLSRQRAAAVGKALRSKLPTNGYPFTLVGKGESDPAVPNTSEKNRRINRRVVIVYTKR